jgi:radical SAM-linked protein
MVRDKVRIRFRKGGELRLVSHHDLMRCFERMLRRAEVPFHSTEGFNPKPRLVFALSLALGIIGCEEVVELELDEVLSAKEIESRLTAQAPAGLEILQVQRIDPKAKAQVRRVCYRVAVPDEGRADLVERINALLKVPHCWVERARPQPRRLDVRPYILDVRLGEDSLEMELEVTPQGTARPDEILRILGLDQLLTDGGVLERTRLEILDEDLHRPAEAPSPLPLFPVGERAE